MFDLSPNPGLGSAFDSRSKGYLFKSGVAQILDIFVFVFVFFLSFHGSHLRAYSTELGRKT